tara:strand:- start:3090 stop:3287 length:198 start_codon:yes stop_codon:yes gene_type:complete
MVSVKAAREHMKFSPDKLVSQRTVAKIERKCSLPSGFFFTPQMADAFFTMSPVPNLISPRLATIG